MGNTVVIYKSRYGNTKQYAEWISKALNCDIFEQSFISADSMAEYSTIIYGGGLYASGILGINYITDNFKTIKHRNIIIFTVGLADPKEASQFNRIIDKNFTKDMQRYITVFHFRGGVKYKELGFLHKTMMAALKTIIKHKKPKELTEDDKLMLETYGDEIDFKDERSIEPLVEYVRELEKKN